MSDFNIIFVLGLLLIYNAYIALQYSHFVFIIQITREIRTYVVH